MALGESYEQTQARDRAVEQMQARAACYRVRQQVDQLAPDREVILCMLPLLPRGDEFVDPGPQQRPAFPPTVLPAVRCAREAVREFA